MDEANRYKAALLTIANQEWPEGVKVQRWAAFVLWGPLCYWCRGFGHAEAWHGCECAADETWELADA